MKFYDTDVFSKKPLDENAIVACDIADKPFFDGGRLTAPYCIFGDSFCSFTKGNWQTCGIDKEYPCDKTLWVDHQAGFLVPKKVYMKEHPEYYITNKDGSREPHETQDVRLVVCYTNPGGRDVAAERAMKWVEAQKDRKIFMICQGDAADQCYCPTCLEKRDAGWNESDLMLSWVNHIAGKIGDKYPDKLIMTYAYNVTQPPPTTLKPAPNVQVSYCAWPSGLSAPKNWADFDDPANHVAKRELEGWLKTGGKIGILNYAPVLPGMAARIKWAAARGCNDCIALGRNPHFRKLWLYVNAHLTWDPSLDASALKDDFIANYFGAAAPHAKKIVDGIYGRMADPKSYSSATEGFSPWFFSADFSKDILSAHDRAMALAPNKTIKDELEQEKALFVAWGRETCAPRNRKTFTDAEWDIYAMSCKAWLEARLRLFEVECKVRPKSTLKDAADALWSEARIRIPATDVQEGQVPPMLKELLGDTVGILKKSRDINFVKQLPDGVAISP